MEEVPEKTHDTPHRVFFSEVRRRVEMISSITNPKIKLVRALQRQRRAREKERLFVIEGLRLAIEAAEARLPARMVLHTDHLDARGRGLVNRLARLGAAVEIVSPEVMKACSDTQSPQGLLAVLPYPEIPLPSSLTFALVLDGLADPGNLGAILRTAVAAGVEAIFLVPGTVEPFNPKVVRAAMGAHFHVPLRSAAWPNLAQSLDGLELWLADSRDGLRYDAVDWRRPCALIVSSEAEGPSAAASARAHSRVRIPMPGHAESLNAALAAGVLLFEVVRQRATAPGHNQAH